jgi:hypothetical protein
MMRARLAAAALAAGIGLAGGCSGLANLNPFHRNAECCPGNGTPLDMGAGMPVEGPSLGDFPGGPVLPPGAIQGPPPAPVGAPPGGTAPVPFPRLVPQPEQAKPMPYSP